jgi:hypothetical protein
MKPFEREFRFTDRNEPSVKTNVLFDSVPTSRWVLVFNNEIYPLSSFNLTTEYSGHRNPFMSNARTIDHILNFTVNTFLPFMSDDSVNLIFRRIDGGLSQEMIDINGRVYSYSIDINSTEGSGCVSVNFQCDTVNHTY